MREICLSEKCEFVDEIGVKDNESYVLLIEFGPVNIDGEYVKQFQLMM